MPHDDLSPAERLDKEFSPGRVRRILSGTEHLKVGGDSTGTRVATIQPTPALASAASLDLARQFTSETINTQQRYASALKSLRAVEERCAPKLIGWLFFNADDLIVTTEAGPEFVTTLYEDLRVAELAHVVARVGRGDLSSLRLVCPCHDKRCGDGLACSRWLEDGPSDEERMAATMNDEVQRALVALMAARKAVEEFR